MLALLDFGGLGRKAAQVPLSPGPVLALPVAADRGPQVRTDSMRWRTRETILFLVVRMGSKTLRIRARPS